MTGKELSEMAFRAIQNDHILWRQWHDVKTQRERDYMILEALESTRWKHAFMEKENG